MRYGIVTANLGDYADPRVAVRLAQAAEEAGWEAFFMWDHLGFVWGSPSSDPWVVLPAVAASTTHLALGTAITPLARRRPQIVANALASLDLLSGGRVVFGAGLGGVPEEFTAFGDPGDMKERAARLDEGLTILNRLWSGAPVTHRGPHYAVEGVSLAPLPLQRPRIPIWIGGEGAPALRRAARWDGWLAPVTTPTGPRPRAPRASLRWWPRSGGTVRRMRLSRWRLTGPPRPAIPRCRAPMEKPGRPGGWRSSAARVARSTR
jgi:alkanesulfonate monooxygenase SsuD/methylene tetrahydromethanopterin reductase-like flavin-dependent oxidoreductase (luciferase family)